MKLNIFFLFLFIDIVTFFNSNAMDLNAKQKFFAFKKQLLTTLKEEEQSLEELTKSPESLSKYKSFEEQINNCNHTNRWQKEVPHPKDHYCINCKTAYDNTEEKTKEIINQAGFVNEIKQALADIIDHEGYIN